MLSGFVLAHRYREGIDNYRDYLVNRFARIYPIYALTALLTVPWMGVSLTADSPGGLGQALGKLATLLVTNLLLIQAWIPQLFGYWNDGGSWSISTEMFFYLLFPFTLTSLARLAVRHLVWVALAAYFLAVLPGLSLLLFDPQPSPGIFYSLPIYRLSEFLLGICAYRLAPHVGRRAKGDLPCLLAVLVLVTYLGFMGLKMTLWVGHNWLVLPVIALVLVTLGRSQGLLTRLLGAGPLVWLGKISYSFYAFQALIVMSLISYHERLVQLVPWLGNNRLLALLTFLVLLGISDLAYRFIEEPLRRRLKRRYLGFPRIDRRAA